MKRVMSASVTAALMLSLSSYTCYAFCSQRACVFSSQYCSKNGNDGILYTPDGSAHTHIIDFINHGTYNNGEAEITMKWPCDCRWGCAVGDPLGYSGTTSSFRPFTCWQEAQVTQNICVGS